MSSHEFELVVGLTGHLAAGKDLFCTFLEPHGFVRMRFSDAIREEATRRGIVDPSRKQLQDLGDLMKKECGDNGVLAKLLLESARERGQTKIIINGARHPDEFRAIQNAVSRPFKAVFVGITAPTKVRHQRYVVRGQAGDAQEVTLEEFLVVDDRDRGVAQPPNGQHSDRCFAMVDWPNLFCNDGTVEAYRFWTDQWLTRTREWQRAKELELASRPAGHGC